MSHLLEEMVWLKSDGAPWHGLGTPLENIKSSQEIIELLPHFGSDVRKVQVYYDTPGWVPPQSEGVAGQDQGRGLIEVPDSSAIIREYDGKYLGTVGADYTPIQVRTAFKFFDSAAGDGQIHYRVAGSLRGGRVVWILASLPGYLKVGNDDVMFQYLLLVSSHDGSLMCRVMVTPIRVVCWNTLFAALVGSIHDELNTSWTVRHTGQAEARLEEVATVLKEAETFYKEAEQAFQTLARVSVSAEQVETYLRKLIPDPEDPDVSPKRAQNTRDAIKGFFEGSEMGADLATAKGTAFGLYNAVARWQDHLRGRTQETRLYSSWFGEGKKLKQDAFKAALELVG